MGTVQEVADALSVSKKTVYEELKAGRMVRQRRVSKGRVGWLESEFQEWMKARPKGNEKLVSIASGATSVLPDTFIMEIILFLCLCARA